VKDKRPALSLCFSCGRVVSRPQYPREPYACPRHPSAELIAWRVGTGLAVADEYLKHMAMAGKDLDEFVERFDPALFLGASQGDLAYMLSRRRAWNGWSDFAMDAIPENVPEPMVLYGRRRAS